MLVLGLDIRNLTRADGFMSSQLWLQSFPNNQVWTSSEVAGGQGWTSGPLPGGTGALYSGAQSIYKRTTTEITPVVAFYNHE